MAEAAGGGGAGASFWVNLLQPWPSDCLDGRKVDLRPDETVA